jgi:hypothetical protein
MTREGDRRRKEEERGEEEWIVAGKESARVDLGR